MRKEPSVRTDGKDEPHLPFIITAAIIDLKPAPYLLADKLVITYVVAPGAYPGAWGGALRRRRFRRGFLKLRPGRFHPGLFGGPFGGGDAVFDAYIISEERLSAFNIAAGPYWNAWRKR
jgi:hypothetical protein